MPRGACELGHTQQQQFRGQTPRAQTHGAAAVRAWPRPDNTERAGHLPEASHSRAHARMHAPQTHTRTHGHVLTQTGTGRKRRLK